MIDLRDEWKGTRIPPGNVPYTDPRTGKVFDASAGGRDDRVRDVQSHRRANPHIYPPDDSEQFDSGFIMRQIIAFMCDRRPEICIDTDKIVAKVAASTNRYDAPQYPCHQCVHTDWKPRYCVSCGGNKLEGWTCNNCGNKI